MLKLKLHNLPQTHNFGKEIKRLFEFRQLNEVDQKARHTNSRKRRKKDGKYMRGTERPEKDGKYMKRTERPEKVGKGRKNIWKGRK